MKRISLRQATRDDWPRILEVHREHQAAQGTNYELPWLFGPAIAIALVGVEESGTIRNCIYVETIAELRFVGCDPKATAFSRREIEGLSYVSKAPGLSLAGVFCPPATEKDDPETAPARGLRLCRPRARTLRQRPERKKMIPISCHATLERSECAPFIKERRMKRTSTTNLNRRSG